MTTWWNRSRHVNIGVIFVIYELSNDSFHCISKKKHFSEYWQSPCVFLFTYLTCFVEVLLWVVVQSTSYYFNESVSDTTTSDLPSLILLTSDWLNSPAHLGLRGIKTWISPLTSPALNNMFASEEISYIPFSQISLRFDNPRMPNLYKLSIRWKGKNKYPAGRKFSLYFKFCYSGPGCSSNFVFIFILYGRANHVWHTKIERYNSLMFHMLLFTKYYVIWVSSKQAAPSFPLFKVDMDSSTCKWWQDTVNAVFFAEIK